MSATDILQLQQPVTGGGIRSVNFFNGRLLTSQDLSREQAARRESDWRLGLAIGDGVAFGLEVKPEESLSKPSAPVLKVAAGLASNRAGQMLRLTDSVNIALTRSFDAVGSNCLFTNCKSLGGGVTYVRGAAVYILTIAPAELSEGRAASNGLDPSNVRCNTDATVEALQFRLLAVKPALYAGLDPGAADFRNALAYRCFGVGVQASWFAGLLDASPRGDDLLDAMRGGALTDYDVPIALVFLEGGADVGFVDLWAVRRPLARAESDGLAGLVEDRRPAVGRAMFMQFQAQIAELGNSSAGLNAVTARSHFRYLPPVGVIPVNEETDATDAQATRFFKGMTYRGPVFINSARLESIVRESLDYPPIEVQAKEMLWLYRVRENRMAIDFGSIAPQRSYLVFQSGHLPYGADAQFDLAHWNYANLALA